jgi:DNA-binding CsgD family transcriptional regulator
VLPREGLHNKSDEEAPVNISEQTWDQTLGVLYEAALEPSRLASSVRAFEHLIQSAGCHIFAVAPDSTPLLSMFTADCFDPSAMVTYHDHFIHHDPRKLVVDNMPLGEARQCSAYFDERYVSRSGFYQDWLLPAGARYVAGGTLTRDHQANSYASFNRPMGSPDFDADAVKLIARYLPHLGRVLRLVMDRDLLALRAATSAEALDQQALGVIGLDTQQHVLHMNAQARVVASGVSQPFSRGARILPSSDLAQAIARSHQHRQLQAVPLQMDGKPLVALVWPAPLAQGRVPDLMDGASGMGAMGGLGGLSGLGGSLHTLVLIKTMAPGEQRLPRVVMQLYGLSPAEARLADALRQGQSVEDHAERCQISVHTVRTQVRSILGKTGCTRLQDLVRMLAALPVA